MFRLTRRQLLFGGIAVALGFIVFLPLNALFGMMVAVFGTFMVSFPVFVAANIKRHGLFIEHLVVLKLKGWLVPSVRKKDAK